MSRHTETTSLATKGRRAGVWDYSVKEFVDRFAEALGAGDDAAVANMCEAPALILGDDNVRAVLGPDDLEDLNGGNRHYGLRGSVHAEIVRVEWATERIALVDVRWPHRDAGGAELGAEVSTYALRRDDSGDLKLCVALLRGETITQ
jgi:hypothetical protein